MKISLAWKYLLNYHDITYERLTAKKIQLRILPKAIFFYIFFKIDPERFLSRLCNIWGYDGILWYYVNFAYLFWRMIYWPDPKPIYKVPPFCRSFQKNYLSVCFVFFMLLATARTLTALIFEMRLKTYRS